jgi:transcriptional regulator with XRE-family HTH domain
MGIIIKNRMVKQLNSTGRKIRALMALSGITQADIRRNLGVTPAAISLVVSGKKNSKRVKRAIAQALGVTVEELWPSNGHKRAA